MRDPSPVFPLAGCGSLKAALKAHALIRPLSRSQDGYLSRIQHGFLTLFCLLLLLKCTHCELNSTTIVVFVSFTIQMFKIPVSFNFVFHWSMCHPTRGPQIQMALLITFLADEHQLSTVTL